MGQLLVYLLLQGVLLYNALGWEVRMPKEIHGLKGSCLVIPCSFSYSSNPPQNPRRIVWYQYVSKGYPLVCDPWHPENVIEKFRGKTALYEKSSKDCSLLITRLEPSHHEEKLYAWIDPDNVGWRTYAFYDVTSTVHVDESPKQPSISIHGGEKMGDTITVECSTFHTCPYRKPTITLTGIEGSDQIKDDSIKDGLWKTTLTRTGAVKTEQSTIKCFVTHYGSIAVTSMMSKQSKCVHDKISIEPELADVTEGVAKKFTCSVYHSCQKESPTIMWNYENMQTTKWNKRDSGLNQISYSSITFLGAKADHGKKLICTAKFSGGDVTAAVVLHVQPYIKPVQIPNEDKENEEYSFNNSCVLVIMQVPVMSFLPEDIEPGTHVAVKCSVNHTCSSHPPEITWSVPTTQETISHNRMGGGVWETVSNVTFIPTGYEEKDQIVCTANFWGGKTLENTAFLGIGRGHGLKLETLSSIVIAALFVFILICVLAGVFMYKKRHRQLHPDIQGSQSQSEQRTNDISMVSGNKPFSKPHMPSPKSVPKSSVYENEAIYTNLDDHNVYGNV